MGWIIAGVLVFFLLVLLRRAKAGSGFIADSQAKYRALRDQGMTEQHALISISKGAHPELSDQVHREIVEAIPSIVPLASFIYNGLNWRRPPKAHGSTLSDDEARAILRNTRVLPNGRVSVDFRGLASDLPAESNLMDRM